MGLDGPSNPVRVEPVKLPEPARDPAPSEPVEEPAAPTKTPAEDPVPA
jgi:hypothetical protein